MVFEVVQKNFDMLGINSKQSEKPNPINKRIFVGFVLLFCNALFQYLYVFHEAHEFQEYIESIYMASIGTVSFVVLSNTVIKMKTFFSLISSVDATMNELENDTGNSQNENENILTEKQQILRSQ